MGRKIVGADIDTHSGVLLMVSYLRARRASGGRVTCRYTRHGFHVLAEVDEDTYTDAFALRRWMRDDHYRIDFDTEKAKIAELSNWVDTLFGWKRTEEKNGRAGPWFQTYEIDPLRAYPQGSWGEGGAGCGDGRLVPFMESNTK